MNTTDRYQQAKKITLIGALINALLGGAKVIGGVMFHSHALVADGVHSFSDLLTDAMVIFASKYGSQDADESHPYGHQRIETAATLLLALILILAGASIAWDSLSELFYGDHTRPQSAAIPIIILSILANEALFHYTRAVGRRIHSPLLLANAWHHRSDAASSIVVLVGLLGSLAGYISWDSIAAVIVGAMIIQMGWRYGWDSVKELVDTAVDEDILTEINTVILNHASIEKVHQLRTRSMGKDIFIDVHILVSPKLTVSEGHFIAQQVHHSLISQIDHVQDVTVHVDPEDDEIVCPSLHLPDRHHLEKTYLLPLQQRFPLIHYWQIHYLNGQIEVDLICLGSTDEIKTLSKYIHNEFQHSTDIKQINLLKEIEKIAC